MEGEKGKRRGLTKMRSRGAGKEKWLEEEEKEKWKEENEDETGLVRRSGRGRRRSDRGK